MASKSRKESNKWLKRVAAQVTGKVLSIGSLHDDDDQGGRYRDYFINADSYTTSDLMGDVDIVLDIRDMKQIKSGSYDAIFCSGVLEHVDDFMAGMREMTRVLKKDGTLILGVPFRQNIHTVPHDYWRFTIFGLEYMCIKDYNIIEMKDVGVVDGYPEGYYVYAKKK